MSTLSQNKRIEIEKAVERVYLDTGLSYPENNLVDIALKLNAKVVETHLPDFQGKQVKGLIKWFINDAEKEANKPFTAQIFLNSRQEPKVKNFTLAHEIGHLLLHKNSDSLRIDLQDYSETGDPENHETEANFFAGTLLMPKDKFINAIKNANSLNEVADSFAVSKPAVESRLKWLN